MLTVPALIQPQATSLITGKETHLPCSYSYNMYVCHALLMLASCALEQLRLIVGLACSVHVTLGLEIGTYQLGTDFLTLAFYWFSEEVKPES